MLRLTVLGSGVLRFGRRRGSTAFGNTMFSKLSANASQVTVADDVTFHRRSLLVSGRKMVNFDAVQLQR